MLSKSLGFETSEITANFGGEKVIMVMFVLLLVGIIVSLVAAGQLSQSNEVDPETGEAVKAGTGRTVLGIVTDSKVLGVIVVLAIASTAVALMSGVPSPAK